MRAPIARTSLAIVVALVLAACSPSSDEEAASPTPDRVESSATPTGEPGVSTTPTIDTIDPADAPAKLRFEATTLDGEPFSGASLYGTPTVLWFWAPWCPICQADAPAIADAIDELPDGVQILGVPGRADEESMREFVAEFGLEDMIQIVDPDGTLWANFSVGSQPAVVLIDATGEIRTLPGSIGKAGLLDEANSIA
jgi:thiol-disulfide isomerase/thioredoxin